MSARDLLGNKNSEFNLSQRMARYIRGKPYQTIIKDATDVRKKRSESLMAKSLFGQTAPVQVAPAQRTNAIMKMARLYVQEARAFSASKIEELEIDAGFPYTIKTATDWKKLSGQKTTLANESYRQTNDFVYDINKNKIEPKNIYMDRDYFIVKYTEYGKGLGKKAKYK